MFGKLLDAFRNTRRRADRVARDQEAYLFAGVVPLGPARLVDLSETGVRIELKRPFEPARATRLLIMDSSQLLDVQSVWAHGKHAGFRVTASNHLRGYTEGEAEQIKTWWIAQRVLGDE